VLLAQSSKSLLLGHCVDVCANDECHDVEEGHPGLLGKELLSKGKADGRSDPGNLHDLHETDTDSSADLVICAGSSDEGHGDKVDRVLNGRNDQVANEDLQDLGAQARPVLESLLQAPDEEVTEGRTDQSSISCHLGDSRCKVVSVLVAVLSQPRGQEFLETSESSGREHLGAQGVLLELLDVGLNCDYMIS
jgi:hypothetical protein